MRGLRVALCFVGGCSIDLHALIPFGLDPNTGRLHDVADVPRGKSCGCICASCGLPLVARHGDVNEWHFAHLTSHGHKNAKKACEFSFFVSVRQMIKQIISEQASFKTPSFKDSVSINGGIYSQSVSKFFAVTEERVVELEEVHLEAEFSGCLVDAVAHVKGVPIAIVVTYPGRHVPDGLLRPSNAKSGVIRISVDHIPRYFSSSLAEGKSYRVALSEYLADESVGKTWVYHPRHEQARSSALKGLEQEWAAQKSRFRLRSITSKHSGRLVNEPEQETIPRSSSILKDFYCQSCGEKWQGRLPADLSCKRCGTHLFVTTKDAENET